jgi:undecaprenyl phosphate-alpha-L-ara4FN deformylase
MKVGLRVDADTLRGTVEGMPSLLAALDARGITASIFFSVGPDNMGRHLWRLLRPAFLRKMLRTGAPSLYGWDILLRGTAWPGPRIGPRAAGVIRAAAAAGHEIGLHAWDHHRWQRHALHLEPEEIRAELARGVEALAAILGRAPRCSAAPGWVCSEAVLVAKDAFDFDYNSDCRGERVFRPVVGDQLLAQVQVPVSLPTWDEAVGRAVSAEGWEAWLLARMRPDRLNVLTVHAEVEGLACAAGFARFLDAAGERGVTFVPLGTLAAEAAAVPGRLAQRTIPGREGLVACLATESEAA